MLPREREFRSYSAARENEVDFVVDDGEMLVAVEVKSGRMKSQRGMAAFLEAYPQARCLIVGGDASGTLPVESFLAGEVPLPWEA